jgi:hypothetical protein
LVVFFFLEVFFFMVVVFAPEADVEVFESMEVEVEVEDEAAGAGTAVAGTAVALGYAADWAMRPVGSATATPIARMRASDLFISLFSFRRGAQRTAHYELEL